MFEEARNKRSSHDYDKAEDRLAKIMVKTVAAEVIANAVNLIQKDDEISRKLEAEKSAFREFQAENPDPDRNDADGLTAICLKHRPERDRLARELKVASESIRQALLPDEEASQLLEDFSEDPLAQLSGVRDALHLIIAGGVNKEDSNLGETAEEMAGASA